MNWENLEGASLCHRETPSQEPRPIILSGVRNNIPWVWTGEEGHIYTYEGAELVWSGEQGQIMAEGEVLAWIAKIDDTPEIADPNAFKMQASALETETGQEYFKTWLKYELAAIAGE